MTPQRGEPCRAHRASPNPSQYTTMSTTIYDKGFLQADAERRVASITVSASATTSTVTGQPNYFHWRFYLVLDPPASPAHSQSVVLDMMPTNPPKGCLIISSQPTWRSTAQLKIEFPIATVGSPKVGQIIRASRPSSREAPPAPEEGHFLLSDNGRIAQRQYIITQSILDTLRFHCQPFRVSLTSMDSTSNPLPS
ncbi:hypothetical protein LshimejAT787_0311280 [Lyophyllum shimeji]|uniref:DUF7770 domain-containing protein n=1 Tax=Lyophyllum shimeji TaxID=47721 RepID=A0A9P3PK30_LYOSH|nr:hypothetical protein LshimejAT787_0311280 [Lyophyllum shimeji]